MPDTGHAAADYEAPPDAPAPTLIAERYRVNLQRPMPHLDTAGGKAYAVEDQRDSGSRLYAVVHEPGVPYRREAMDELVQAPAINMLNPLAREKLAPASGHSERLITLLEAPGGPSLADAEAGLPINAHRLRQHVVPGLIKALRALHDRGINHRAIRPQTIFFASEALDEVVLGECVTAPPGADQPDYCEPLERASAERHGRGEGDAPSDLFALGAALVAAHLGETPGGGRDPEKLFAARVAQGSFWALSGGAEIPGIVGSLIRGLVTDDSEERWTLREVRAWLDSALPKRRRVHTLWTFARPVSFRGESFSDRRLLARELARHPLEGAAFLRSLDFSNWVASMITTELFSERLERLLAVHSEGDLSSSRHGDHAMVARVCAHFDPRGPIRFRDLSPCIDGIGPALAQAYRTRAESRLEQFNDLFADNVLLSILEIVGERHPTVKRQIYPLSEAARRIREDSPGGGLTRALYDLNESLPCLSPQFQDRWIDTPEALLAALNERASGSGELSSLLDSHVLAFFASRVDRAEIYIARMGTGGSDRIHRMVAILELLAFLQTTLKARNFQSLTEKVATALRGLAREIRSKSRREAALARLDRLGRKGDLRLLKESLDLRRLIDQDARGFHQARGQLEDIARERRRLSRPVQPDDPAARLLGYRLSASLGWLALLGTGTFLLLAG